MNHSQKLSLIEDQIKDVIKEKKAEGKDEKEIKKVLAKEFNVSIRTAQRYYLSFNEPDYIGCLETSDNKKEINIYGSRLLREELAVAVLIEDDKERLERIGEIIKISSKIQTY